MARKPWPNEVAGAGETDEGEPTEGRGRSARKRATQELTKLGEELLALRPERLAGLTLPEQLVEALAEARRLKSFGAQRRQGLFIGKLMRKLDEETLAAIRKAVQRN